MRSMMPYKAHRFQFDRPRRTSLQIFSELLHFAETHRDISIYVQGISREMTFIAWLPSGSACFKPKIKCPNF